MVPKFRAFSIEAKTMHNVLAIDFSRNMYCLQIGKATIGEWFWFREIELMQSTGLKDKNGVEIFEGDVGWDAHFEEYGEVVFENGSFRYEFGNISEDLFEVTDDIEIVGNIYENPELLEQANEN
ncbi:YopX family protein [Enterococcus gallinarum]|uniref:YopX family protein n=1 Tax=Enterococcus gallinarum TaxID=1353 RepID=UPI001D17182E|nr:YopX family protein [Enterococcus gallinarum]MCC4046489.1 YopX family protein [Enterococcus gallinarum]